MFPEATVLDKNAGWQIDLKFLKSIQIKIGDKAEQDGYHRDSVCYPSPEEIESILLAAYEVSKHNASVQPPARKEPEQ